MIRAIAVPDELAKALRSAHRELLDKRAGTATKIGIAAFALETVEPWLDFHDPMAVKIQLAAVCVMILAATFFFFTAWGARHRLALFTFGYFVCVAGFEAIVFHERAFGKAYSDGFPLLYAFYCVLIPTTVLHTGLIGLAVLLVTALPEVWVTGEIGRLFIAATSDGTAFAILLCGRHLANASWEREFIATRLRSDFVSNVSHEFRTPLTSLCRLTEQLAEGKIVDEAGRATCYGMLVAKSHELRELIEGLLDFGSRAAKADESKFENIDPAELVTLVAREFERNALSRGRRIEVQVSGNAPLVVGDRIALRTVLWNLLDNAVKYSPEGDTVWADVGPESGCAAIRIRDQGLGIPDAEQPYIFEKFVRGGVAKRNAIRGIGLGLALVQLIVTAHRGEIRVESKVGKGSTFTVLLPAASLR